MVDGNPLIRIVAISMCLFAGTNFVNAQSKFWIAGDGNWTVGTNWAPAGAPQSGSTASNDLGFNITNTSYTATNDIADLYLLRLVIGAGGNKTIAGLGVTFKSGANHELFGLNGTNNVNLDLTEVRNIRSNVGSLVVGGAINSSTVTYLGTGLVRLSGSSINSVPTSTVNMAATGNLFLDRTNSNAALSNLLIQNGTVHWLRNEQVSNSASVQLTGGKLNLNGFLETISQVTNAGLIELNGGDLITPIFVNNGIVTGHHGSSTNEAISGIGEFDALTLNSTAKISPGTSVGTLSVQDLNWEGNTTFHCEINTDNQSDLIAVNGLTTFSNSVGNPILLDLDALAPITGWNPNLNYSWTILSSGQFVGFDSSAWIIDASGFAAENPLGNGAFQLSVSGQELRLEFVAIPEPGCVIPFAAGVMWCLLPVRRQSRKRCSS